MHKRVVVAMSGGVDSSVAAALLKKQGFEVIGVTLCFNLPDLTTKKPRCCGLEGINDARGVAEKLGIKHYVFNMQKTLEEKVIKDFCLEYAKGRTPNPCVRCNQYIKFRALLKKVRALGADFLATGHYARITDPQLYRLKKAKDRHKDQSYFLYHLKQNQLRHILFPLGNYTKDQVRVLARKFHLPVAEKKESQEICFLPGVDYRGFLKSRIPSGVRPGEIVDLKGNILG
ncbi:MAG: tRNA 2-thiouridine(34) synthase MnmA, partial [Candidatus Omnitrophica bacterium]|nr:tRNA 2-thiouridine(34) synthase MnmA [Candidatus Omnitrophota bacterium]